MRKDALVGDGPVGALAEVEELGRVRRDLVLELRADGLADPKRVLHRLLGRHGCSRSGQAVSGGSHKVAAMSVPAGEVRWEAMEVGEHESAMFRAVLSRDVILIHGEDVFKEIKGRL
jgi:hypothetical protein